MSCRAALALALWSMGLMMLGGCASLPFFSEAKKAQPPAALPPAQFELEIVAPDELRKLLLEHMDLARLQHAPEADSLTSTEVDRLVAAAAAQVRSLLETEGYFNPDVQVQRIPAGAGLPRLKVSIEPGPRTRVDRLTLEIQGPLELAAGAGDTDALELRDTVAREWALQPGQPFQVSTWESAKNRVLATLRKQGYLAASWSGTVAQVDAPENTVRLFLVADSGPLFHLGAPTVAGLERYDARVVIPLAEAWRGQPASEQVLREFQERVLNLGLFQSVIISVEPDVDKAQDAPVLVAVRELTLQSATVGVGFSDDLGLQATLEHTHRDVFGSGWWAKNKFQLGTRQNFWQGDLISHPRPDGWRDLVAGQAENLDDNDEIRLSWHVRAGRTIDGTRILRLVYGEYASARLETVAGVNDSSAVSANYHWIWRNLDDQRAPLKGLAANLQGAAGWSWGDVTNLDGTQTDSGSGPFVRAYARLSGYQPLGDSWYGSARVELGQVFVQQSLTVPDTLLFRAGGDDSVRGYAYRSLGPQINGAVVGGTALFTASVQVEHPMFDEHPEFLWALFVDAGNAADGWGALRPVLGYGAGVHWRSPVGPLRLDLAYAQDLRRFRLSFSVGVSF